MPDEIPAFDVDKDNYFDEVLDISDNFEEI